MSKVLGSLLPGIAGEVWAPPRIGAEACEHRRAPSAADHGARGGERSPAVAQRLAAHADFRSEDAGELSWWGRELSGMERGARSRRCARLADEGEPIEEPDEPPRWLRGRLEPHPAASRCRSTRRSGLQALVELLRGSGPSRSSGDDR